MSLRHKEGKEGVDHPARTDSPAPAPLTASPEETARRGGKYTQASLYIKLCVLVMDS